MRSTPDFRNWWKQFSLFVVTLSVSRNVGNVRVICNFHTDSALLLVWHRWLRDHDPSTVDDLLEAALLGKDKKTTLAAAGTLLAAADALARVSHQII